MRALHLAKPFTTSARHSRCVYPFEHRSPANVVPLREGLSALHSLLSWTRRLHVTSTRVCQSIVSSYVLCFPSSSVLTLDRIISGSTVLPRTSRTINRNFRFTRNGQACGSLTTVTLRRTSLVPPLCRRAVPDLTNIIKRSGRLVAHLVIPARRYLLARQHARMPSTSSNSPRTSSSLDPRPYRTRSCPSHWLPVLRGWCVYIPLLSVLLLILFSAGYTRRYLRRVDRAHQNTGTGLTRASPICASRKTVMRRQCLGESSCCACQTTYLSLIQGLWKVPQR